VRQHLANRAPNLRKFLPIFEVAWAIDDVADGFVAIQRLGAKMRAVFLDNEKFHKKVRKHSTDVLVGKLGFKSLPLKRLLESLKWTFDPKERLVRDAALGWSQKLVPVLASDRDQARWGRRYLVSDFLSVLLTDKMEEHSGEKTGRPHDAGFLVGVVAVGLAEVCRYDLPTPNELALLSVATGFEEPTAAAAARVEVWKKRGGTAARMAACALLERVLRQRAYRQGHRGQKIEEVVAAFAKRSGGVFADYLAHDSPPRTAARLKYGVR
jgi:hypothetical protein